MRLGIDLVALDELDRLAERAWFIRYVFAEVESAHAAALAAGRRREFLAGRFAAKEAVLKVLGVGLFGSVAPRHIVLAVSPGGAPRVALRDSAARTAAAAGIAGVTVSITHKRGMAAAVALGWGAAPLSPPQPAQPGQPVDDPLGLP